jgi:hypothetical protein
LTARRSIVVHGRLAAQTTRLAAARAKAHGTQILTTEQLAARLAGGFVRPIERTALQDAVRMALASDLGELDAIKDLPGMVRAGVDTLQKIWRSGLSLSGREHEHPRLAALARLEAAALAALPAAMLRPADLVTRALDRLAFAPAVLGPIEIRSITEMSPCWRPLLFALAQVVPVTWSAGARETPGWLEGHSIEIRRSGRRTPMILAVSCSNARHEAVEALRWARSLLASGRARPDDIAIAAASPVEYDDHVLAAAADANLDIHFVHGVQAVSIRDGQAAAALAEVLLRGLSQDRVRRLFALLRTTCGELADLPADWTRVLPPDAPLLNLARWRQLFSRLGPADWPGGVDRAATILPILETLENDVAVAAEAGERFLSGPSRAIWRKALKEGPAAALDVSLADLRIDDGLDPATTIAWMPAAALAATPRRFVRLVGLTSRDWPRGISEDRLLPDHVIPIEDLDPLPVAEADRRDFRTILAETSDVVVLSRARRDAGGRQLGRSPLLPRDVAETYLRRARSPEHALSEVDRLLARPAEFAREPVAASAHACWSEWHRAEITGHDGLVQANHPLIRRVLARPQSATSLRLLLRDPLGYLWQYALGFDAPTAGDEPVTLDAKTFGDLVHEILEEAVTSLDDAGGFAAADGALLASAVSSAKAAADRRWDAELPIPPTVVWQCTLAAAAALATAALSYPLAPMAEQRSWTEVPFGDRSAAASGGLPWDPTAPVEIPGTGLTVRGVIDRLDLSGDGRQVRVVDYKTGRVPRNSDGLILAGGKELQRCLYAFAVRALLGDAVSVEASLLYPRIGGGMLTIPNPEEVLTVLTRHLSLAKENLLKGRALPGTDAESQYNPLAFALPGNAKAVYCERKLPLARELLGRVTEIWEHP